MPTTSNKFASMMHKNTNKITLVLTYALLEWTLIFLLILNSIFSYFITKFAQFFNLKPPCFWCTNFQQIFKTHNQDSHKDAHFLCEKHSEEVSRLGFCSKHKKLGTFCDLCEDCSVNGVVNSGVKRVDFGRKDGGFDDLWLNCSCCGAEFKRKWLNDLDGLDDFLGFCKNGGIGGNFEVQFKGKRSIGVEDLVQFEKRGEHEFEDLEFCLDYSGNQLVPIESIDRNIEKVEADDDQEFGEFQKAEVMTDLKTETVTEKLLNETDESSKLVDSEVKDAGKTEELSKFAEFGVMEFEETDNSLVFHANSSGYSVEKPPGSEPIQTQSDTKEEQESDESDSDNEEAEVSIGTEIPVLDSCDEMKAQDNFNMYSLSHEEPSSTSHDLDFNLEYGLQEVREDEKTEDPKNLNQEDDTLLVIERKDSMADESFDGSELEGGDPIDTTEKLKWALRAERKALQALYTELEEERSASAIAASETMAMINRLQEEKAAMQMEALHYQRMMEEQSEYDQEALQLLNELMVKKDKELELYRKKVMDYEAKERMRFSTSSVKSGTGTGTCSASCSHSEDGDGLWVDIKHEAKEVNGNQESQNQNSQLDTTMALDASFVDFEDERLSILEQLKVLEEKLFTLSDEEDCFEENGKHLNGSYGYNGQQVNGITRYQDRGPIGSTGSTGKQLLPLFDALEMEKNDGVVAQNGNGNGFHPEKVENNAITRFELQKKRIDIEEEVDQLYIRLQALEADREFLKHCIGSLKKGDKGMELLQEILQHLRDLKNVDLREKSFADGTLV